MTTGRINQVTIVGRSPEGGAPHRPASPRPGREAHVRHTTLAAVLSCKASHTRAPDGGAATGLSRATSPAAPERSTEGSVDGLPKNTDASLFAGQTVQPRRTVARCRRGTRRERLVNPNARLQTEPPSKPGNASAGRDTVPHAAPRQHARRSNVLHDRQARQKSAWSGTLSKQHTSADTLFQCTPHSLSNNHIKM